MLSNHMRLNTDWQTAARQLPMDITDTASQLAYRSFIELFGSHYVTSCICGGSAMVTIHSDQVRQRLLASLRMNQMHLLTSCFFLLLVCAVRLAELQHRHYRS